MGRKEREEGEESRAEREKRWLLIPHTGPLLHSLYNSNGSTNMKSSKEGRVRSEKKYNIQRAAGLAGHFPCQNLMAAGSQWSLGIEYWQVFNASRLGSHRQPRI